MMNMDPGTEVVMAAIVTLTVATVEALKRALAKVPVLDSLPTALYAVLVSVALTYGANVAGLVAGEWNELARQAVVQALLAFGVITAPTWTKAIGESRAARDRRVPVVLVAVALAAASAGCASALVNTGKAVHAAVAVTHDSADIYCGVETADIARRSAETQAACKQFYQRLDLILQAEDRYLAAVASDSPSEVPSILAALTSLEQEARALFTDPVVRAEVQRRIDDARRLIAAIKGGE